MPFNFHVGFPGPFSYSRRISGGRPGPTAREQVADLQAQSRAADTLSADDLRTRNAVDWMLAVPFALLMLWIGGWAIVAGLIVLAAVYLRHKARDRKRMAAGLPRATRSRDLVAARLR
jgi:hypothetical protein